MNNLSDTVFPEPDGEWIGAEIFVKSQKKFDNFLNLKERYGYAEQTAAKFALQDEVDWPDEVKFKLSGY